MVEWKHQKSHEHIKYVKKKIGNWETICVSAYFNFNKKNHKKDNSLQEEGSKGKYSSKYF